MPAKGLIFPRATEEITQLIQHMILSADYLKQLKQGQLKNHLQKLIKIQ